MKTIGTTKNSIVSIAKLEENSDELDNSLKYDILGKELSDQAYDEDGFNMIDKGIYLDNIPIKIEELEKVIKKFKKDDCNYMSIDYNCDHNEYTFFGVDVHIASEEELKEENENEKNKELKLAETYLKNINKERDKILQDIENLKK